MTEEQLKQEVVSVVAELFKDKGVDSDIIEYVDLIDDLGMDSITFISIVVELEVRFSIEFSDDVLLMENFKNIGDITSMINVLCEL